METDFIVSDHGTIFLFEPQTTAARRWINEHLPDDVQRWGRAVVVEHRYIEAIVQGVIADGYTVEGM